MGWSGGTYTKGNAGTGGWTGDASLGIGIEAGRHDTQDDDFATGINQCLNKDGSNSCTGDLNLGGFKPVNLAAGTAAAPAICAGGDVNTGIFSAAADQIGIATNGTERVRIDDTGRIGIGTTTPGTAIDVQSTTTVVELARFVNSTGSSILTFKKSRSGTVGANTIVQNGDRYGLIAFQGANGTSYNDAAYISAEVDGTPGASNDMPGRLIFSTSADGSGTPTERMRITNGGLLGLNTTTPAYRLQLGDDSAAKPTTNTWIIASDARIKTNIADYSKGLTEICQLRPITYDYNGKGGFAAGPGGVSILAQEIQPIFPECVGSFKGKLEENDEEETDILNYNGHAITFALIKAIQELNAKVEALEARVAELEAA